MKKFVVTISREYGSRGREIGLKLAEALGVEMYDKDIIRMASEKSGLKEKVLQEVDETAANPLFTPYYPPGIDPGTLNDRLYKVEADIIKEKAAAESCIIVGRCGNYVLKDDPDALHVYIYADLEKRIEKIMKTQEISDHELASRLVKKVDKHRKSYYHFYTDMKSGEKEGYDMMLDSGKLGVDGCVAVIKAALEARE